MDIHLRLFSERLRRLLAGEEGMLPDTVKQHLYNLHTKTETIVTCLLTDYEADLGSLLLQVIGKMNYITDRSEIFVIVKEINNLVRESEKAIDTFVMNIMQNKCESSPKKLCDALLQAESKINGIKQRIQQLQPQDNNFIDIFKSELTQQSDSSSSSLRFVKDEMEEQLLDLLIDGQTPLSIVAIFDSSGLEKTPLAAEAYNSNYVKNYFDCCAWVSCENNPNKLLDDIMKRVMPPSALGEILEKHYELKRSTLHDYLRDKKYLIVLDDVWHESIWEYLRDALPDYHNGSRAMIVFSHSNIIASCQLENGEKIRHDSVLATGALRAKFGDFPFIVFFYGGTSLQENMYKMLYHPYVRQMLSILESPFHLKLCLLYLSAFSLHSEISTRKLYQLWISEGFIPDDSETTAEKYLEELIERGFIQVKKRRPPGGAIKTCSLHNMTWNLIYTMAMFTVFIDHCDILEDEAGKKFKRLASFASFHKFVHQNHSGTYLHSFLCLTGMERLTRRDIKRFCERFKLLKVLDLGTLVLSRYPAGISNLLYLRYLKLNIPSLKVLPASLCNLLNLNSLDMPSSYIDHTPDEFWKMNKLRHLNFGYITLPAHPEKYCSSLKNLNYISALHPICCTEDILSRLPSLQDLRIYGDLSFYQSVLSHGFCKLSCLKSLKLVNKSLQPSSMVPGKEYEFLKTLTHLSLSNTELKQDPMPTLEKLSCLQVLKLKHNSYLGRKLTCGSSGFKQLQVLHLKSMLWLEEWTMGIGAMPKLESLIINPCAYLRRLPEELWSIKTLCKLELLWPQPELRQKLLEFEDMEPYDIQIYPYGI